MCTIIKKAKLTGVLCFCANELRVGINFSFIKQIPNFPFDVEESGTGPARSVFLKRFHVFKRHVLVRDEL